MLALPVHPLIIPGESFANFLSRLASANYLRISDILTYLEELHTAQLCPFSEPPYPPTWVYAYESVISRTTNKTWSCNAPKICIRCLAEKKHCMESWDLTLNTVCPWHKTLLQNRCPQCGVRFCLNMLDRKSCTYCKTPFAQFAMPSLEASDEAVWLCQEFRERLIGNCPERLRPHGQLNALQLHCLASCLGELGCNSKAVSTKKRNNLHQIENLYPMTSMGGRLLLDWPTSFHTALKELYARIATANRNSAARFADRLRLNIYERLKGSSFDFVRAELERHSHQPCSLGVVLTFGTPALIEPRQVMPVKNISKITDIDVRLLRRLVAGGKLSGYRGPSKYGNQTIVADVDQAKNLSATLPSILNVTQAASRLNLPVSTVKTLVKHEFFICLGGKPGTGQSWWIDASSFDTSSIRLKPQKFKAGTQSIREMLHHPCMTEDGVVSFFQTIQEGAVPVVIRDRSFTCCLGDWRIPKNEATSWMSAHMMQMAQFRLLSVRQAAKYLDVTEEVAYDLVRNDLLKSTIETKNGATYRRVTLSSIEDFKRSYITGAELAYALAIPSNQVLARMLNLKISPIAGPSPGLLRCRRYFWSRLSCLYAVRPGS